MVVTHHTSRDHSSSEFKAEDGFAFAERLGLTGVDADLFYEAYYRHRSV